jgi:hypothetical protein
MLYKRIKLPYVRVSLRRAKEEGPHCFGRIRADIRHSILLEKLSDNCLLGMTELEPYKKDRILLAKEQ